MQLWVTPDELCEVAGATDEEKVTAAHAASQAMWADLGRRFGIGNETVRPCRSRGGRSGIFDLPIRFGQTTSGSWFWGSCSCSRPDGCSCSGTSIVKLPRDQVREVTQVTVDGEVLNASDYVLRGRNRLYRVSGSWPCCQNLELETTETGTWEVSYQYGIPVPHLAKMGALRLGCELLKLLADDDTCRLPASTRNVVRQGVTFEIARIRDKETGITGLYEVDLAVDTLNPYKQKQRATAWSPEVSGKAVRVRPDSS